MTLPRAFTELVEQAPDAAARRSALQTFERLGWPSTREEAWRYTDLADIADQDWQDAGAGAPLDVGPWILPGFDRVVFINGRYAAEHSSPQTRVDTGLATPEAQASGAIVALNAALARDGVTLRVDRKTSTSRPIHVLCVTQPGAAPLMSHLRHHVELAEGAEAQLVFEQVGLGDGPYFLTEHVTIRLEADARLRLTRLQRCGAGVQALSHWTASLARGAALDFDNADVGGRLIRNDIGISLEADGAEVALRGLFLPTLEGLVDNHVVIRHGGPRTRSRQQYRGIAAGRGRGIYNGRVQVEPGAAQADSGQKVDSLLLSPRAQINAKPELVILHDDVKCSHGATCGQLDDAALHYLRTRGISRVAAHALLVGAFATPVLAQWPEALRGPVDEAVRSVQREVAAP